MNEQQQQSKPKTQEHLSTSLSQDLKTYDFGNFENWKLKSEII